MIKQFNLDRLWKQISQEALSKIDASLASGAAQNSTCVEDELKKITHRKHVITTSNCTDALTIILRQYPVGSEIIVPCYSFIATATPILLAGLKPVFVDIDHNYHLDLNKVQVTENTRAMILVSLFGNPADYMIYKKFCNDHNIDLIEDAAQSFGSKYIWSSGTVGTTSAYSFSPTKPCPVLGSGGAILTDDDDLAEFYRLGRLHGKRKNSDKTKQLGINSMMGTAEAQQLMVSLKYKDKWQERRTKIAEYYDNNLIDYVVLPPRQGTHNWHKYVVKTNVNLFNQDKVAFAKHYSQLITDEPIFNNTNNYLNARDLQETCVSLPICPYLTDAEIEIVVDTIIKHHD